MNLWELFLTSRQVKKIEFLEQIISKSEVSADDIAVKFSTTNRLVKGLIEELNFEQQQVYNNVTEYYLFENRMIKLSKKVTIEVYVSFYLHLKSEYINQSSVFKFLLYFLTNRKVGMIKLSNHFNYSQSYCYKLINKANKILKQLDFDCQINKKLNYLLIEGDENQIRLLTYILEITSNRFNELNTLSYAISNSQDLSIVHQSKMKKLLKIFDNAIKLKKYSKNSLKEELEVMVAIYKEVHLGFHKTFNYLKKNNKSVYQAEKMFFYLITIYYLPEYLSSEIRNKIGRNLSDYNNNSIVSKATECLDILMKKYSIPEEYYETFLFQIIYRLLITKKLSLEILFFATNSIIYTNANIEKVSKDIQRVYVNELSEKPLEVFSFQVAELLYSYIGHLMVAPIKISIHSSYRANYLIILKNVLNSTYKKEAVLIVEKIEDADIVISDSSVKTNDKQIIFYFEDIHCIETWKKLGDYIQTVLIKRRIHLNI